MERITGLAPEGANSFAHPSALHSANGRYGGFVLLSSSGFIH